MSTLPLARASSGRTLSMPQVRVLAICFLVAMVDGFDTLMLSFIAPLVGKQFGLAPVEIGKLFAAGFVGAVAGALCVGPLADRFGRRVMLLICLADVTIFTLLCAQAQSPASLMALRFAAGLGLGGAMPTVIALTAENMPPAHRASAVTWMFLGFPLGAVVGGGITAANLSHGWQAIFLGGGLAALAMIPLALWGLPESRPSPDNTRARAPAFASLTAQFGQGRAASALLLWLGVFCVMLVSYFLVSWMPTVLTRAGFSPERAAVAAVLLNLGGIVGALLLSFAIKLFGPWRPVAAAFALGSFMVWLLGQQINSPQAMIIVVFITGMCIFGGQLSTPAIAVHLFPTPVRGAGTGWTMGVGRMGSIAGPVIGGALVAANLGWPVLFLIVAVPTLLAALAIAFSDRAQPRADVE